MKQTTCPQSRSPRRAAGGFMLIEVLISVLIFSVGLMGLVALQARAHQFSVSAEDTNRAALLANEIVSVMWANQSASSVVPSATYDAWRTRVATATVDGLPNGDGKVTVAPDGRTAEVQITWRAPMARAGTPDNRFVTQVVIQ